MLRYDFEVDRCMYKWGIKVCKGSGRGIIWNTKVSRIGREMRAGRGVTGQQEAPFVRMSFGCGRAFGVRKDMSLQ